MHEIYNVMSGRSFQYQQGLVAQQMMAPTFVQSNPHYEIVPQPHPYYEPILQQTQYYEPILQQNQFYEPILQQNQFYEPILQSNQYSTMFPQQIPYIHPVQAPVSDNNFPAPVSLQKKRGGGRSKSTPVRPGRNNPPRNILPAMNILQPTHQNVINDQRNFGMALGNFVVDPSAMSRFFQAPMQPTNINANDSNGPSISKKRQRKSKQSTEKYVSSASATASATAAYINPFSVQSDPAFWISDTAENTSNQIRVDDSNRMSALASKRPDISETITLTDDKYLNGRETWPMNLNNFESGDSNGSSRSKKRKRKSNQNTEESVSATPAYNNRIFVQDASDHKIYVPNTETSLTAEARRIQNRVDDSNSILPLAAKRPTNSEVVTSTDDHFINKTEQPFVKPDNFYCNDSNGWSKPKKRTRKSKQSTQETLSSATPESINQISVQDPISAVSNTETSTPAYINRIFVQEASDHKIYVPNTETSLTAEARRIQNSVDDSNSILPLAAKRPTISEVVTSTDDHYINKTEQGFVKLDNLVCNDSNGSSKPNKRKRKSKQSTQESLSSATPAGINQISVQGSIIAVSNTETSTTVCDKEKLESIVVTPQSQLDTVDEPIDYSMRKLQTSVHDLPTPKQDISPSFHDRPTSLCDPSTPADLLTSAEDESTTSRDISTSTQHLPTSVHEMPTSADVLVESYKRNRIPSPIRDQSEPTQNLSTSVPELPGTRHEIPKSTQDLLISKHRPNTTHTLSTPESDVGAQHNRVTHDLPTTALPQSTQRIQSYVSYQRPMKPKTPWRTPFLISNLVPRKVPIVRGCNSSEKIIQQEREAKDLPVLYSKFFVPDFPAEPKIEYHEITEPITIPLEFS